MRHSQLSNEQILVALSESYNVVASITKYQLFLTSAIGLPKDDPARSELLTANVKALEKIRTEIRALEHELDRREDQENDAFDSQRTAALRPAMRARPSSFRRGGDLAVARRAGVRVSAGVSPHCLNLNLTCAKLKREPFCTVTLADKSHCGGSPTARPCFRRRWLRDRLGSRL